jgi:hypothetical protein
MIGWNKPNFFFAAIGPPENTKPKIGLCPENHLDD